MPRASQCSDQDHSAGETLEGSTGMGDLDSIMFGSNNESRMVIQILSGECENVDTYVQLGTTKLHRLPV